MKGADTIGEAQSTKDNKPESSGFIIEHIVPILTESEKMKIKQEVNDTLFQVFKKYYE